HFLAGLTPAMLQRTYLVERAAVGLARGTGPSTPMACQLCAGVAATETLKIILGRGDVVTAPRGLHFDAYRCKYTRTWRPGGNANPLQKLLMRLIARQIGHPR